MTAEQSSKSTGSATVRARRRERGASLVLVSGALVAFVAIAALAVDYGQLVAKRRAMITATDAASLAAATVYATGGVNGCDEALVYMNVNAPNHESFNCQHFPETGGGVVEVSSSETVSFGFGSVIGLSSGTAYSSTASEFVTAVVPGLRPFMLCQHYDREFSDWLDAPSPGPLGEKTFIMSDNLSACLVSTFGNGNGGGGNGGGGNGGGGNGGGGNGGGGNGGGGNGGGGNGGGGNGGGNGGGGGGNWAIVDFDGQSNGTPELRGWIANGYDGPFETCASDGATCPPDPTTCTADSTACYSGSPGVLSNAVSGELDGIIGNDTVSLIPIVRHVTDGSGSNLEARVDRVVMAELLRYEVLGAADVRSLTFRFMDPDDVADPAVRICGSTAPDCP